MKKKVQNQFFCSLKQKRYSHAFQQKISASIYLISRENDKCLHNSRFLLTLSLFFLQTNTLSKFFIHFRSKKKTHPETSFFRLLHFFSCLVLLPSFFSSSRWVCLAWSLLNIFETIILSQFYPSFSSLFLSLFASSMSNSNFWLAVKCFLSNKSKYLNAFVFKSNCSSYMFFCLFCLDFLMYLWNRFYSLFFFKPALLRINNSLIFFRNTVFIVTLRSLRQGILDRRSSSEVL